MGTLIPARGGDTEEEEMIITGELDVKLKCDSCGADLVAIIVSDTGGNKIVWVCPVRKSTGCK